MKKKINPVGFQVEEDCTLDGTNFYFGEIITIPIDEPDNDWKGVVWFESFPQIFKPVYSEDVPKLVDTFSDFIEYLGDDWSGDLEFIKCKSLLKSINND